MRPPEPSAPVAKPGAKRSFVPHFSRRGWLAGAIVLLVIAAIIAGILVWRHYANKPKLIDTTNTPSNQQIATGATKDADTALAQKNYSKAAQEYLSAAAAAQASNNNQQAEADLQMAIAKIPDRYVPYTIYDTLYTAAKALNDKPLEISSLQKALSKASQPDSGAPAGLTDLYQQLLKGLGK